MWIANAYTEGLAAMPLKHAIWNVYQGNLFKQVLNNLYSFKSVFKWFND